MVIISSGVRFDCEFIVIEAIIELWVVWNVGEIWDWECGILRATIDIILSY